MSVPADIEEKISKLQKDVEEIRENEEDDWHERRPIYEKRIRNVLEGDKNCTILYLEIDGVRSLKEIEKDLISRKKRIPQKSLWRAAMRLRRGGLIKKTGTHGLSPVFSKKPWAFTLDMDTYVRTEIQNPRKRA